MEFGVFAQLFVPKFERAADPNAEHKRIMRNVEIAKAADQNALQVRVVPAAPLPRRVLATCPGPRRSSATARRITERVHLGSAIFNITPAGEQAGAHRRERRAARPPHRATASSSAPAGASSTTEVHGFDIADINETKAMWREAIAEIPKMWKDGHVLLRGQVLPGARARGLPEAARPAHPAMWVAAGSPPTFAEAAELGLGAFCFTTGAPEPARAARRSYKDNDRQRHARRRLRQRQHHGRHQHALHGGPEEGLRGRRQHGHELLHVASPSTGSTTSRSPTGLPEWPNKIPEPTPEQVEQMAAGGFVIVGDPDDCANGVQQWVDDRLRPADLQPHHQHAAHRGRRAVDGAVRPRGHPAVRQGPGALHHPLPRGRVAVVALDTGRMALPPELRALAAEVSNWGRWGDDDELGTLNLIDDAAVARGAGRGAHRRRASRWPSGSTPTGPQLGTIPGRINPLHTMVAINRPTRATPTTAASATTPSRWGCRPRTHWDALAHVSYDGLLYNGFPASSVTAERGATRCGIHKVTQHRRAGRSCSTWPGPWASTVLAAGPPDHARPTSTRPWTLAGVRAGARRHRARPHRADDAASRRATARATRSATSPGLTTGTIRVVPPPRRRRRRHRHARHGGVPRRGPRGAVPRAHDPAARHGAHPGPELRPRGAGRPLRGRRRVRDAARRQPRARSPAAPAPP